MHYIIPDLQKQINKYSISPKYFLLDWIDINKLNFGILSAKPNAK